MMGKEELLDDFFLASLLVIGEEEEEAYRELICKSVEIKNTTKRSVAEMRHAILEWTRMGYSAEEVGYLVKTTLVGLNALSWSIEDLIRAIKGQMVAFNIKPSGSMKIIESLLEGQ